MLYLRVHHTQSQPRSLDEVYDLLIPSLSSASLRASGVMGGLTMTDHPFDPCVAYMVHPCQSRDAIQVVSAGANNNPQEYLLRWFGIIGGVVGLSVPISVVQALCSSVD